MVYDIKIIDFVKSEIEPLQDYGTDSPIYRCSATLIDDLYLPCVVIKSHRAQTKLAIRRFQECRKSESGFFRKFLSMVQSKNSLNNYPSIVGTFVCGGNRINGYDIKSLARSPFAIPPKRMSEIKGETSMCWTQFTARMKDGSEFEFGTTFLTEFFNMPEGYKGSDITKIIPAKIGTRSKSGEMIFREKPFFECFVKGI